MITDDELDRRMSLADPARGLGPTADSLGDLLNTTGERARSARPRHRRRLFAGLGVAAIVLIGGATALPAAADAIRQFLAQSDWDPPAGGEILADSEWVDLGAPDLAEYVRTIYPEWLPLPEGTDREALFSQVVESFPAALPQEVGIRHAFEWRAQCLWLEEWRAATNAGEQGRAAAAADVIAASAEWPAIVATDGGGIADDARKAAELARSGDKKGLAATGLAVNCAMYTGLPQ